MKEETLIPVADFCASHDIEIELIERFYSHGLIEIHYRKKSLFLPEYEMKKLEQILLFHRELEINLEGIETIFELLHKVTTMQERITDLENKLQRFTL